MIYMVMIYLKKEYLNINAKFYLNVDYYLILWYTNNSWACNGFDGVFEMM